MATIRFLLSLGIVALLTASARSVQAQETDPRETIGTAFVASGSALSLLALTAFYIGLHRNEEGPDDPETESIRTGVVAGGALGLGLGAVLITAGICAALDAPPDPASTRQRVSIAPRRGGAVVEVSVAF